jgi:PIN domain nuclease of toxin-antitoxin system
VLDASALLALLEAAPGAEQVADAVLAGAAISTLNLAEAVGTLATAGLPEGALDEVVGRLGLEAVGFDLDAARRAGLLVPRLRERGLGIGAAACLALAQQRALPALTADPAWAGLQVGVAIRIVR